MRSDGSMGCTPFSQEACSAAAMKLGLKKGGRGHKFAGKYRTKGCYAYKSGKYKGRVYYGTGGSFQKKKEIPKAPKYRPEGHDCVGMV